jgi:hypothetical protein
MGDHHSLECLKLVLEAHCLLPQLLVFCFELNVDFCKFFVSLHSDISNSFLFLQS